MTFADVPAPPAPALQNVGEFGQLWEHAAGRPHANVLEIGSLFGGTLWYWSHLPDIATLTAVDLPAQAAHVRDSVAAARSEWHGWLDPRVDFRNHQADSQHAATVETVRDELDGALFDVAFIDGDHSYEGVRIDWLLWSPLVRPGGLVAFHDTWPNFDRHEPGVVRWVDELRHHLPCIEWTDPDGVGICAFTLPEDQP